MLKSLWQYGVYRVRKRIGELFFTPQSDTFETTTWYWFTIYTSVVIILDNMYTIYSVNPYSVVSWFLVWLFADHLGEYIARLRIRYNFY